MSGKSNQSVTAPIDGGENLSQIRDILFGRQMEDYEARFTRLEDRIVSATSAIQTEFTRAVAEVDTSLRRELKALATDLRAEHETRATAIEQRLENASTGLRSELDAVREEIAAQVALLRDAMDREHELVTSSIHDEAAELQENKVDRAALAALLSDVAAQLESAPVRASKADVEGD